jgi:creatinine deaminase
MALPSSATAPEGCGQINIERRDRKARKARKAQSPHRTQPLQLSGRRRKRATAIAEIGHNPRMDALVTAIEEAERGRDEGGIPIGAVLLYRGEVIGRGHNRRVQQGSAVLHGEMDALERAGRQPASVYRESVMYTTLSPCAMCSGAILLYGIPHVVVGENRTFMGEEAWLRARGVRVDVVQDERCIRMMTEFIAAHPELWNEDIGD